MVLRQVGVLIAVIVEASGCWLDITEDRLSVVNLNAIISSSVQCAHMT